MKWSVWKSFQKHQNILRRTIGNSPSVLTSTYSSSWEIKTIMPMHPSVSLFPPLQAIWPSLSSSLLHINPDALYLSNGKPHPKGLWRQDTLLPPNEESTGRWAPGTGYQDCPAISLGSELPKGCSHPQSPARQLQWFQESSCVSLFLRLGNLSKKISYVLLVRTDHKPTPKPMSGRGGWDSYDWWRFLRIHFLS